jgi:hypothetical protein
MPDLGAAAGPAPSSLWRADNVVTSRNLRILVDHAAQPIASSDAYVVAGGCDVGSAVGWSLAEGPVRPVGVVVIDVFAKGVVEMSSAGDEDAVGALASGAGDPPFADRVRAGCLDRRGDDPDAGRREDGVVPSVYLASRSLMRNFRPSVRSPRSMRMFRACCTVHAAVGWAVTPAR